MTSRLISYRITGSSDALQRADRLQKIVGGLAPFDHLSDHVTGDFPDWGICSGVAKLLETGGAILS